MDFVSPFIEPIVPWLLDPLMKQIKYLFKAKKNVLDMANKLEDLRACRAHLQKEIEDANRKQKQSINEEVKLWLQKVGNIEVQMGTITNNYGNRGCLIFGDCSLNCWLTYKYSKEAVNLVEEMVKLKKERDAFHAIATMQPPAHGQDIPTETTLLGIDWYLREVRKYLVDDTVGVIGIHGMGGVGKTTLLKEVNNSLLKENKLGFEFLIWAVVTKEFQSEKLQAQIANSLGLELKANDNASEHARFIFNYLKDKNFLLFLDDIWKGFNLIDVGIPDTRSSTSCSDRRKRKQKVILTTRFMDVCGHMYSDKIIKVECLNKTDASNLFKRTLGERVLRSNLGIHHLIEEVVDECAGLPLALTVIARAMASKTTIQEWAAAVSYFRRSQENKILGEDHDMFSRLKFSYDSLKNDALRRCFLHCPLWPEDADILKYELIKLWIGVELINDFESITEAWDKGYWLIEELKGACLLEAGVRDRDDFVKMHDVIRDLALWIASDCGTNQKKWLVKSGIEPREAPLEVEKWKEAEVVSLMDGEIQELPSITFECPRLSFLMLPNNSYLHKIHPSLFQNLNALTCLDLSFSSIVELPESVGLLKMLQYLNLSNSELRSLPRELGNLTRLRYLDLQLTQNLENIHFEISSLLELQVLDLYGSAIGKNLEEFECLPRGLKGLGIDVHSTDDFRRFSMLSRVFTWNLAILTLQGLTILQLNHNIWCSLRFLRVYGCSDVEVVEVVDAEGKLDTCPIEFLGIYKVSKLKILWRGVAPSTFFRRLKSVSIVRCHSLKSVSWILRLPSLAQLELRDCKELECLVDDFSEKEEEKDGVAFAFPSLRRLALRSLPTLSRICGRQYGFPALEDFYVMRCPELKIFPFPSNENASKLREIWCEREWWEGLQWDDESIKNLLEEKLHIEG